MKAVKKRLFPAAFLLLFGWLSAGQAAVNVIAGKVIGVSDGDTITVLDSSNKSHKIRLYGIDAPEKKQRYGQRSKRALSDLVYLKKVRVLVNNRDRYGRVVGTIKIRHTDINRAMVKAGHAWAYVVYSSKYAKAHIEAQAARVGIWAIGVNWRFSPWNYRKCKRAKNCGD